MPFADLEKWSVAERRTRGATETVRLTRESVSAVVAGMAACAVPVDERDVVVQQCDASVMF